MTRTRCSSISFGPTMSSPCLPIGAMMRPLGAAGHAVRASGHTAPESELSGSAIRVQQHDFATSACRNQSGTHAIPLMASPDGAAGSGPPFRQHPCLWI